MFSTQKMTVTAWMNVRYFKPTEFRAPFLMGWEFMLWLDNVRALAGVPMSIVSDSRTPAHNREVGGASESAHVDVPCNAVDVWPAASIHTAARSDYRFKIVAAAFARGCTRVGLYKGGHIHLDRGDVTDDGGARPTGVLWVE